MKHKIIQLTECTATVKHNELPWQPVAVLSSGSALYPFDAHLFKKKKKKKDTTLFPCLGWRHSPSCHQALLSLSQESLLLFGVEPGGVLDELFSATQSLPAARRKQNLSASCACCVGARMSVPPPCQPLQLYSEELSLYPSTRNKFRFFKHFRVCCRALADALLGCRALAVAVADVNEKSKPILT